MTGARTRTEAAGGGLRGALGDMGVGACGCCAVREHAPGPGRAPGWGRAQGRGWAGRLSARSWSTRTGPAGPPRPAQDLAFLWLKAKNTCLIPPPSQVETSSILGLQGLNFFYMNSLSGGLDRTVWAMKQVPG